MKKKKVLALSMTAVMAAAMLAGCGGDSGSGSGSGGSASVGGADSTGYTYAGEAPITKEEGASLKILAETSNYTTVDIASAEIVETVIANAGITVDWNLVDYNNYADSVGPMLTAGSVDADIILLPDQDQNQVYIKSGMFVALDNYFSVMPNFSKWLDANPVIKAELTAEDGHIYYVPGS